MTVLYLISKHPQGTPAWKADRAGRATGSRAKAILAGAETATRRDYLTQLAVERLLDTPVEDSYVSKEMQHGLDQEPFGRMELEAQTGELVEEAGFLYRTDMLAGCSVDGFTANRRGFVEIKCPKTATHVTWLLAGRIPPEHVPQIVHNFEMTGCEYVDFASYDPRVPKELQLFHVRAERSEFDAELRAYRPKIDFFLREVDALEAQLRKRSAMLKEAA